MKNFRQSCKNLKQHLRTNMTKIKDDGKSLVGYGAIAKSFTLINYCGLTNKHIDYICDSTPCKAGPYIR